MEVSTRVASDELLTRGDGLIWMEVVGCEDGSACVRGIAGMDVEGGWTRLSGSSDVESMSMAVSISVASVASITASAFPSSRMSSMMVMMVGVISLKSLKRITHQRNTHVIGPLEQSVG